MVEMLDLFRIFHRMIHFYEAQEAIKSANKPNEKMGLNDDLDIQVTKSKSQEVK